MTNVTCGLTAKKSSMGVFYLYMFPRSVTYLYAVKNGKKDQSCQKLKWICFDD